MRFVDSRQLGDFPFALGQPLALLAVLAVEVQMLEAVALAAPNEVAVLKKLEQVVVIDPVRIGLAQDRFARLPEPASASSRSS